jgi:hypothetical protein
MTTNMSTSNQSLTSKRSIMIQTTFLKHFMRFQLAKQFFVSRVAKLVDSSKAVIFIPHTWSSGAHNNCLARSLSE